MTVVTATPIRTGIKDERAVGKALASVLADTYRLMIKTHVYHWNVEGPNFFAIHNLTEGQYQDMFAATDELAERLRALGLLAPLSIKDVTDGDVIEETVSKMDAMTMVGDLAEGHERLAHRLHALIRLAEAENDPVTADMATARSAVHEKAAWMLRATAA